MNNQTVFEQRKMKKTFATNALLAPPGRPAADHEEGRDPDEKQEAVGQVKEEALRDGRLFHRAGRQVVDHHVGLLPPDVGHDVPVHDALLHVHGGDDAQQPGPPPPLRRRPLPPAHHHVHVDGGSDRLVGQQGWRGSSEAGWFLRRFRRHLTRSLLSALRNLLGRGRRITNRLPGFMCVRCSVYIYIYIY